MDGTLYALYNAAGKTNTECCADFNETYSKEKDAWVGENERSDDWIQKKAAMIVREKVMMGILVQHLETYKKKSMCYFCECVVEEVRLSINPSSLLELKLPDANITIRVNVEHFIYTCKECGHW